MNYAIIGFGNVGQALAGMFARKDIEVVVASTRSPEEIRSKAEAIGPSVTAKAIRDAVQADVILLAVPYWSHREVASTLSDWHGKTVIDVTNSYGVSPEELGNLPSSSMVARAFTGAKVAKAFNHLAAETLAQDPAVNGGRRVIFVSGDDDAATKPAVELADRLGFAPVKLGTLSDSSALVQAHGKSWAPLIFEDLVKFD